MNCKPGDLAYVAGDCYDAGSIVEVVSYAGLSPKGFPGWVCKTRTPLEGVQPRTGKIERCTILGFEDRNLRPISGVPVDEERRDEVTA